MIDKSFDHPRTADIKPTVPVDIPKMDTAFTALGLSDALAFGVQEMGYVTPTPIQAQAIPVVLKGGDVIGSAQTGTGKTAAFALPIIQRLGTHGKLRCLILEPTRELALQVEEAFQKFAKFTDLRVTIVYGGVGYGKQRTICVAVWTSWRRRRGACWTIWRRATARWRMSTSSCSTKSTGCSTWASCPM
jgi:ATP-dependent RNA helicase RhlE